MSSELKSVHECVGSNWSIRAARKMIKNPPAKNDPTQFSRFVETARKIGCDEDKERFEKSLGKIAAYRPPKKDGAVKSELKKRSVKK